MPSTSAHPSIGAFTPTTTRPAQQDSSKGSPGRYNSNSTDKDPSASSPTSFYPTPRLSPLQQVLPYSAAIPIEITGCDTTSTDITAPSATSTVWEPQRPDYSPITPKVQPILPAIVPSLTGQPLVAQDERVPEQQDREVEAAAIAPVEVPAAQAAEPAIEEPPKPTTQYVPRPKPKPFSSEDSTDAIALRAAISALQFQKKKAQNDVRTLEATRRKALQDPLLFKNELAAGRIQEHRPTAGDMSSVLDVSDSEGDEDEDEDEDEDDLPDDQEKDPASRKTSPPQQQQPPFFRIPGPQTVVRMPPINWEKYHIVGPPLDELHEQQRRWPGSFPYTHDRGREHSVAAPYSPFYDTLYDANGVERKDSAATVSEHPMETRRNRMGS